MSGREIPRHHREKLKETLVFSACSRAESYGEWAESFKEGTSVIVFQWPRQSNRCETGVGGGGGVVRFKDMEISDGLRDRWCFSTQIV